MTTAERRLTVTARGDLAADEASTVELFERAAPSVVYITNLAVRRGAFGFDLTEVPQGTGSGIVWDDKTLADYLKDPKARVPDGKMEYAGLKQQAQLDDVIAYLQKATQ